MASDVAGLFRREVEDYCILLVLLQLFVAYIVVVLVFLLFLFFSHFFNFEKKKIIEYFLPCAAVVF